VRFATTDSSGSASVTVMRRKTSPLQRKKLLADYETGDYSGRS